MTAPPVHATYVLPPRVFASRYTKRCVQCRVVRGNSQFTGKPNRRGDVCRFCADAETQRAKKLRELVRKLTQLRMTERRLAHRLEALRAQIRAAENEAVELEQANLFTPNRTSA